MSLGVVGTRGTPWNPPVRYGYSPGRGRSGSPCRRLNGIEGERGIGQWSQGKGQEWEFLVVTRDAVGAERTAAGAAVDQGPFAVLADGDGDGLHRLAARAAAVARLLVQVPGPEAARASRGALERFEKLDEVGLLLRREIQVERRAVVVDHIHERRESPVVVEPAARVRPEALERARAVALVR